MGLGGGGKLVGGGIPIGGIPGGGPGAGKEQTQWVRDRENTPKTDDKETYEEIPWVVAVVP